MVDARKIDGSTALIELFELPVNLTPELVTAVVAVGNVSPLKHQMSEGADDERTNTHNKRDSIIEAKRRLDFGPE